MAGVSLLSLIRRLKTVVNTRKITKAMALVSASKYQKARVALYKNNIHFDSLKEIVFEVATNLQDRENIYFQNKEKPKKLIVVCNSEKGMVGSYNSQIIGEAIKFIENETEKPYVITTGKKGLSVLKRLILEDKSEMMNLGDVPTFDEIHDIYDHIMGLYSSGFIDEVYFIYSKYISPVKNMVTVEKLLPLDFPKSAEDNHSEFEFQPSTEEMMKTVFNMYIKEKIYNTVLNSKTAEQSIRMAAMNGATKNADEIIISLNKQYNRLRQSAITQEISEIVGGAEALR